MEQPPPEKKTRLYYGSLEEQERARLEAGHTSGDAFAAAVQEGIRAGNINITPGVNLGTATSRPCVRHRTGL